MMGQPADGRHQRGAPTVLMMRDEDAFVPAQDWLHMLGVSMAVWGVLLTAIQRELRSLNP